ncbi:FAD-dependent oxidoreductase [Desulfococcaceae bacterium HSG9]|nr:FAD-dependent oxidoreductase [Desulfococcaceae bacterium HSG9]
MAWKSADVVVIGGGIIGTAIAYFLSRQKIDVILLEKDGIASGSSGACDGAVVMQTKKPGVHLKLAMESHALLSRMQDHLQMPIEFEQNGGLIVIETDEEKTAMKQFVKAQRQAGLDVELLDHKQLHALAPHLSDHLISATYSPQDSTINPIALTLGFAMGAKQMGAEIITGSTVSNIEVEGRQISAVETAAGKIETRTVVNATGVYASEIGRMLGIEIPIKPRRGQLLVTEARPDLLKPWLGSANYIAAKFNPQLAKEGAGGVSIDQTQNGNFLIGATREFVGYDKRTTTEGLKQIASRAVQILPVLKNMHLIRAFAGLRPYTPDGLPILGKVEKIKGFIMAAGHEGDGIALSAITGKLISELVSEGKTDVALDSFNLNRFSNDTT